MKQLVLFMDECARNNFSEKELREIATALGCDFDAVFTLQDTGETI